MKRFLLPLAVFAILLGFLAVGLGLNPREVPSPLIGRPAPAIDLAALHRPDDTVHLDELRGEVWILNVWASWCAACVQEHPVLVKLAEKQAAPIVGLNYKDERQAGIAWLGRYGDPYRVSAYDDKGRVGIEYGVYGVPETFVIDTRGYIRMKHIGPLTNEVVDRKLLPLVAQLKREAQ